MHKRIVIGKVRRAHGLRGLLRVELFLEDPKVLSSGCELLVGGVQHTFEKLSGAPGGAPAYLMRLKSIAYRDQADPLRGKEIELARCLLPVLEEGSFFLEDLVGLHVHDKCLGALGEIERVSELAGRSMAHLGSVLIPLDGPFIVDVDWEEGRVEFDLPEGLIDVQS